MIVNEEEMKYKEVINTLHSLQRLKAPAGFEADLMRRINSGNYKNTAKTFWPMFLTPSRLIPSSIIAAAAIIILFILNFQSETVENPLMSDPRVREDFIIADEVTINAVPDERSDGLTNNDSSGGINRGRYAASASNSELFINKSGLNFRQVNLSQEERERLKSLKAKIRAVWTGSTSK
jgi:hypothetical protein